MRNLSTSNPARRTRRREAARRSRRRVVAATTAAAAALLVVTGVTATTPTSQAQASGTLADFALVSYSMPAQPADHADDTTMIYVELESALSDAADAIAAAEKIADDIDESGLDVRTSETTVDTAELESAAARLAEAGTVPATLAPTLTDDLETLTASVTGEVDALVEALDAAEKRKAEAERKAAEEARKAAEAAAAEAAAAAQSSSSTPQPAPAGGGGGASPAEAQAIASGMLGGYGWGQDQFGCLVSLWNKESGWNYQAYNPSSGAFGIPQALPGSKMASAGADWQTSARTQIAWGLGYISARYGSPCGAWSHSQSYGWY